RIIRIIDHITGRDTSIDYNDTGSVRTTKDPQSDQTLVAFLDLSDELLQQDVYAGIHTNVTGLIPTQRVLFLADNIQWLLDYETVQTIISQFSAEGDLNQQDVFSGLLEDVFGVTPVQTVVYSDNTRIIVDYPNGQTLVAVLDADGETIQQDIYEGISTLLAELTLTHSVITLPDSPEGLRQQLIQDHANQKTVLATLDASPGQ
ncbi:MAG: hypothetical protein IH899_02785, partial [Planctomycetes bacterium]|nr:hypothetical protein [Planctomycetota bacterium]